MTITISKFSNIARPYALAAFEFAKDKSQLSQWKAFIEFATDIVQQPAVTQLLQNPQISVDLLLEFFTGLLTALTVEQKNFLTLLVQNRRIIFLPEILVLFNSYCASLEKVSVARMITAVPVQEDFRQQLSRALTNRIKRNVTLHCEVDPAILGGAIIHIGDTVIDGSIRGKLTRLLEFSLR